MPHGLQGDWAQAMLLDEQLGALGFAELSVLPLLGSLLGFAFAQLRLSDLWLRAASTVLLGGTGQFEPFRCSPAAARHLAFEWAHSSGVTSCSA